MESDTNTLHLNTGTNSKHKHTLMMALGCIILLLLLGILWVAGVSQNVLSFGILLLCPVMHLLMMKNLKHGETPAGSENKREL